MSNDARPGLSGPRLGTAAGAAPAGPAADAAAAKPGSASASAERAGAALGDKGPDGKVNTKLRGGARIMYDLRQVGERTWYVFCHDIFGFYQLNETDVCMIDAGWSDEAGHFAQKVLEEKGWNLKFILNTHTHIDHLGGNRVLMEKWGCPAYATRIDRVFAEYEVLEPSYMFGGRPSKEVQEAFMHPGKLGWRDLEDFSDLQTGGNGGAYSEHKGADERAVAGYSCGFNAWLQEQYGPEVGLEIVELPGHTFGMVGVKTSDDVWFVSDALLNRRALEKYPFGYLIDVQAYLSTLEFLKTLSGSYYILAHGRDAGPDISELIDANIANIQRHISFIKESCRDGKNFDLVVRDVFMEYGIKCNEIQYTLIGSAVRCFLTYLQDRSELECYADDGLIKWRTV